MRTELTPVLYPTPNYRVYLVCDEEDASTEGITVGYVAVNPVNAYSESGLTISYTMVTPGSVGVQQLGTKSGGNCHLALQHPDQFAEDKRCRSHYTSKTNLQE
jgi:hypothetical protein